MYTSSHAYLLTFFVCFFVLFRSCCSHARVFGKHSCMSSQCQIAIVNGNFFFSGGEIVCLGRSFVYQNQIKLTTTKIDVGILILEFIPFFNYDCYCIYDFYCN